MQPQTLYMGFLLRDLSSVDEILWRDVSPIYEGRRHDGSLHWEEEGGRPAAQ